jgi:PAS domain S-box-containing protein
MPMVLADPNLADCPVVYCNDAFCDLTGYERAEILGRNCRFLQGPDTDRDAVRRIAEALAQRRHVHEDLYNYRKDGRGLWVALEISPVFDEDGSLRFFFGSQVDITWRREAKLLQARHIESIRALSMGVAHEFNNLMTVVTGVSVSLSWPCGDHGASWMSCGCPTTRHRLQHSQTAHTTVVRAVPEWGPTLPSRSACARSVGATGRRRSGSGS